MQRLVNDIEDSYLSLLKGPDVMIRRVCRLYGRGDDYHYMALYQEVLYTLWKSLWGLERAMLCSGGKEYGWVYTIAVNTAKNYHKSYHCKVRWEPLDAEQVDAIEPCEQPFHGELFDDLMVTLSPLDQRLLMLSLSGYNYEEIADMEKLSPTAVGARLSRLRSKLRKENN